ncbi:MAG: class I SAM-dependent methyltransferase [Deltaproteobacteria bacterium]|nr:class I SAM-dependent methyltransferase [Deltaproteobacteria bacterium]
MVSARYTKTGYIENCPVGCHSHLEDSEIILPEGPLKCCVECGQLVSPVSEKRYFQSMEEFDKSEGTWPHGKAAVRLSKHTGKMVRRLEKLLNKPRTGIRLLDVGCSSGAFIFYAMKEAVHAEGVEPAPAPAEMAVKSGLKVQQGLLQELQFPGESFNVVTLFEVIEHLRDPVELLRECHRILSPEGILIIRTGNTDSWTVQYLQSKWEYFQIKKHGGHISFFNPFSMRKLGERMGFRVEILKTHRVSLHREEPARILLYRAYKILSDLLNTPSAWAGKGHEMIVYLRK